MFMLRRTLPCFLYKTTYTPVDRHSPQDEQGKCLLTWKTFEDATNKRNHVSKHYNRESLSKIPECEKIQAIRCTNKGRIGFFCLYRLRNVIVIHKFQICKRDAPESIYSLFMLFKATSMLMLTLKGMRA